MLCGPEVTMNAMLLPQAIVPAGHSAAASASSLCKLLSWHQQGIWQKVMFLLDTVWAQDVLGCSSNRLLY